MAMTLNGLSKMQYELELEESRYLRSRGWNYSCDFPGAAWLWTKKLNDGRVVAVNRAMALGFEEDSDA